MPAVVLHDRGGDGPTVLVLHATGFCGRAYDAFAAALTSYAHVVAVDLPAHGLASDPGDLSWKRSADALAAAVAGHGPLRVAGHSMGGAIALRLATLRPVDALWVYEPSVIADDARAPSGKDELAAATARRRHGFGSRAAARAAYADREPFRRFRPDVLDAYLEHGLDDAGRLRCTPDAESRTYAGNDVAPADVAAVRAPVTIAHGRPGEFGGTLVPPAAASVLPQAQVVAHDDLTHFGPFEQPERLAAEALVALAL